MTLTVRSATVTGATTKGSALTHAEMDANWAHVIESSNHNFTQSGSGAVSRTVSSKLGDVVSVKDFGATGDGSTDDTSAINAAITACLSSGAALYFPEGVYKITSTLTTITGQFTMYGDGPFKTRLQFAPTAADTMIYMDNAGSRVTHCVLRDFACYSTDTTYVKVAIDARDLSVCTFDRIYIHGTGISSGAGQGAGWGDSTNASIGIRFQGREAVDVSTLEIIADKPLYFAANPNTSATDGEDCDHFHFQDCYLIGNANPLIEFAAGIGAMELTFDGYQAWVGGTTGFKINDTRVGPTVTSRGISFKGVRREQGESTTAYVFDCTFTAPVQNIGFEGVLMASGSNGIKLDGFARAVLSRVTAAMTTTQLTVANVTSSSVLVLSGCTWQSTGTFTTTGLSQITATAYRSASYSAPSDAVYAGQITDTRLTVEKVRATSANSAVAIVCTGTTGDGLQMIPQAAGSGAVIRAVNNAESDFEPITIGGETIDLRYRTGVATLASALNINTSGVATVAANTATPANGSTSARLLFGTTAGFGIYYGSGAPTVSAAQGSFYMRSDGSSGSTRAYINTDGGTTWTAVTTAT
jgi:hypothetical protein